MEEPKYTQRLSASDISLVLEKYNHDFMKTQIIGSPEQFYKELIGNSPPNMKGYICFFQDHWFTSFYLCINKKKYFITFDSMGKFLPEVYRQVVLRVYKDIEFYYCPLKIQNDSHSCGIYSLAFIFTINNTWNQKNDPIEELKKIQKREIKKEFSKITKILINELPSSGP